VSTGGSSPPRYEFVDHPSFEIAKAALNLSASEIDDHMWQIEDALLKGGPLTAPWSVPLPGDPSLRVAVSDSTAYSPSALRLIFRVEAATIVRLHVERRGFTPAPS
jgi:hypothetical protein